ncbi:MAG: glycosyltransferase [Thermodesulfobacteriota bacterium]|nr:glycosyltransferase [Thermodesulfobacteriota bacterium]
MIVKDEEKYLPRCLGSIKPVVDEMIIVDTGSIDRTKDIAKLFGAKVYDFEWNDDFSEARNFSLSKAAGEWIFVLDADEVVSPIDYGELKDLITRAEKFPVAYSITTRNYVRPINVLKWVANDGKYREEEAGTGWYPSPKIRLFNNDPRMRFQGRVHEVIEPSLKKTGISPTPCSVPVHHYGKLIDARNISKGEEYYLLGKKKIEERGGDFKSLIELATQAGELKRHDEAVELWQQVIGLKSDMPVAYLNMSTAYMEIGDYAAGLEASKNALNLDPELKEAALNYSTCAMCAGEPKRAILTLEGLLQQAPEHPVAMALLSGGYCLERDKEKAFEMMNRIKNMGFECGNYLADLSERLISSKRIDSAILLLEAAVENGNSTREIRSLLSELKG